MPSAQSSASSSSNVNAKVDKKIAKVAAAVVGSSAAPAVTEEQQQAAVAMPQGGGGGGGGVKTPPEQPEFIKQALIIIEKKVRNLEKRKVRLGLLHLCFQRMINLNTQIFQLIFCHKKTVICKKKWLFLVVSKTRETSFEIGIHFGKSAYYVPSEILIFFCSE
jgi:hypothetical protein